MTISLKDAKRPNQRDIFVIVQKAFLGVQFFLLLLVPSAKSQDPYFIRINHSRGLPSPSVYDILQDRRGFIWIAGEEGLTRYDGSKFTTYYNSDQTSTAGSALMEDRFGRIWYQNFDGILFYFENDSLRILKHSPRPNYVPAGIIDDYLLVPSRNGMEVFDLKTLEKTRFIYIPDKGQGLSTAFDEKNFYWIKDNRLLRISSELTLSEIEIPRRFFDIDFKIFASREKNLLVSKLNVDRKTYVLKNDRVLPFFQINAPKFIQNVCFIDGEYWICCSEGIYVFDSLGRALNGEKPWFEGISISKVFKDRQGNYWVSSTEKGIFLIPERNTHVFREPEHFFTRIHKSPDGFYLGTADGEVISFSRDFRHKETILKTREKFAVESINYDEKTGLFIIRTKKNYYGTRKNIKEFSELAIKSIVKINDRYYGFAATGFFGLLKSPIPQTVTVKPTFWDSLFTKFRAKNESLFAFLWQNGRAKSAFYLPAEDKLYVATNQGLFVTDSSGIKEIKKDGKTVMAAALSGFAGTLLIHTNHKDLIGLNSEGKWLNLNAKFEIPPSEVQKIKTIDQTLYIITSTSIKEVNLSNPDLPFRTINIIINPYEISDIESYNEKLFLVSEGAVISVDKNNLLRERASPMLHVNSVEVKGKIFNPDSVPLLKFSENDLRINFSVLDFGSVENPMVFFRLNNNNWEKLSRETRTLKFPAMNPGKYSVQLAIGANGPEIFSETIHFKIQKPFWATWWFWGLVLLILIAIILYYYRRKTEQLMRKNKLLAEKMQLEQELARSTLTSIKAQMNPHFFYNALNTIQSFIYADDKRSAGNYLGKFSKLTRTILEMSEKDNISLSEEIQALSLYLELEKMRFGDEFSYVLRVGDEVEPENIKIPPMIIQPYVENALKHGLLHLKGRKKLDIHFYLKEDCLIVEIDDNGIGRKKSEELNKSRGNKHQSFAGRANSKRLEILNHGREKKVGVEFTDKSGPAGRPMGTTVTLTIPNQL